MHFASFRRRAATFILGALLTFAIALPVLADGGEEARQSFLEELSALPHYREERAERYLKYYGSKKYTGEQILRIVNTNSDLTPYEDMEKTDTSLGVLMLVNKHNTLGRYEPENLEALAAYGSWGSMESEARAAFATLVDAAAQDGRYIWGVSPYRSYDRQSGIYYGYVARSSRARADTYSARPGSSEHQTGLAVDVAVRGRSYGTFGGTKEFEWMAEHAHEYGFILRYGEGMEYITGYIYEPWHYRYVGVDAATYIHDHDLTFEEYYYYYVVGDEELEQPPAEETEEEPAELPAEEAPEEAPEEKTPEAAPVGYGVIV